jgi:hypothetical protein
MQTPPRRPLPTTTQLAATTLATGPFAVASTLTYGSVGLVLGAGLTAVTVLVAVLREVFWLRALGRSVRHQRWLLESERGLTVDDVLRLGAQTDAAVGAVVARRAEARVATPRPRPRR